LARFLALDWDHDQLHIVAANVKGGGVRISGAVVWPQAKSPNPAEAAALGQLLKERLKEAGIAPAPVLACVGRDRVVLKELRYPAVPAHEEPAVVRFQAAKEITEQVHDVVIDYTSRAATDGKGDRRALALILRKEMLAAYQTICQAAGLKLAALTPRPFGIAAAWRRQAGTSVLTPAPEAADAAVAVLVVSEKWAEFCVVQGEHLLFSRSLAAGGNLAGEVRRSLAVYSGQAPQHPVTALYLASNNHRADLRDRLQELLQVPVHFFDPFAQAERPDLPPSGRGSFAGAVGLLAAQAGAGLPINFVKPREPRQQADPNRRKHLLYGALAATALFALVGYAYLQLADLNSEVAWRVKKRQEQDNLISQTDLDERRFKALKDWTDAEVVWLDELYDLTDRFPNNTGIQLSQMTGDPLARTAKVKHAARVVLKGATSDDHKHIDELMSELVQDGHYRVEPKSVGRNTGADRRFFPQQFTMKFDIEKLPPEKYTRKLVPPAPEERRGRGGDGDFGGFGFGPGGN
jgi:hypothetical protein